MHSYNVPLRQVDVTTCEPVAAFCSSDEEGEDENVLSFLPIAPEIEDPEVTTVLQLRFFLLK